MIMIVIMRVVLNTSLSLTSIDECIDQAVRAFDSLVIINHL